MGRESWTLPARRTENFRRHSPEQEEATVECVTSSNGNRHLPHGKGTSTWAFSTGNLSNMHHLNPTPDVEEGRLPEAVDPHPECPQCLSVKSSQAITTYV